jgi:hypothetical protein
MIITLLLTLFFSWTTTTILGASCTTHNGMSRSACLALRQRWQQGQCGALFPNPPVVWIGIGCKTPCAQKAEELNQNPRAYCKANGNKKTTYSDGGCHVFYDCNIHCEETCNKQIYCKWEGSDKFGSCIHRVV